MTATCKEHPAPESINCQAADGKACARPDLASAALDLRVTRKPLFVLCFLPVMLHISHHFAAHKDADNTTRAFH